MRVAVAPDKFKGSASAAQVAARVAAGLTRTAPGTSVARVPTGAPLLSALAVRGRTALVEMAAASGLAVLPGAQPAALQATRLGTGQLVRAALDLGCTQVVLGLGDSACTDGGAGLLVGLGARLRDARGEDLPRGGGSLRHRPARSAPPAAAGPTRRGPPGPSSTARACAVARCTRASRATASSAR